MQLSNFWHSRYSARLTEATLEMHYHHAIVQQVASYYGADVLRFLKPSPQKEAWVAFDQAWVKTSLATEVFLAELQAAVHSNQQTMEHFFLGYFLQYKRIAMLARRSRNTPTDFRLPYFRAELSLRPNDRTGLSQHDTLARLARIDFTSVCYACPMWSDSHSIYKPADLDDVRCVDIRTAPPLTSTERQFLTFQNQEDKEPRWGAAGAPGSAYAFRDWIDPSCPFGPKNLSPQELAALIHQSAEYMKEITLGRPSGIAKNLPQSFTVIELQKPKREKDAK